ncbi:unnamed protein product, partial [Choristocarpus tenellus]
MQLLSCLCSVAGICVEDVREGARVLDLCAECVYICTVGCMTVRGA